MPEIQMSLIASVPEYELGSKQDGMIRVEKNMDKTWGEFAFRCVGEVAAELSEFTSDDVDARIQSYPIPIRSSTHDKRALGDAKDPIFPGTAFQYTIHC